MQLHDTDITHTPCRYTIPTPVPSLDSDVYFSRASIALRTISFEFAQIRQTDLRIYFHCAHGKDRTGTMAALYRIEVDGWTADQATQEMQAFGYRDIYKDLIAFVRAYTPRGYNPPR